MGVLCEILLHKPSTGLYRPGQPVTGIVKYAIDEPTEFKEIVLSLTGKGRCNWTETERSGGKNVRRHYTGSEEYLSYSINLLNKKSEEIVIIPAGTYERDFEFLLPFNIPGSFKDCTSSIVYRLKLRFFRPGIFKSDKRFYAVIPVCSYLETEENDASVVFGLQKTMRKPFTRKKQILNLRAQIDHTVINPEDELNLSYVVTNDSNIEIKSVKTELAYKMTYTANCGKKKMLTLVVPGCVTESPSVPAEAIANLSSVIKTLPGMYSIDNTKLVKREYKIIVTVVLPVPHFNSSVEMPVLIGCRAINEPVETVDEPPPYWEVMKEEEKS